MNTDMSNDPANGLTREKQRRYAHYCRDEHEEIGHNDSEHERCPLCRANDENDMLREALAGVMALIDEGKLVRDTSNDPDPSFAMRQLPFVMALSDAAKALASARGRGPR